MSLYLDLSAVDIETDANQLARIVADSAGYDEEKIAKVVIKIDSILESVDFPKKVFIAMGKILADEDQLVETLRELMDKVTKSEAAS
jgi:hypothetical protein